MKANLSCIPCIMKQAYNTAVRATADQTVIREILSRTAEYVKTLDLSMTPADASNFAYEITRELSGNPDPYEAEKKQYNNLCLSMLPELRRRIGKESDRLTATARAAILGNLIDLGIGLEFDLERDLERIFSMPFGRDDTPILRAILDESGKRILYLGDNAGEIVFDRLFVEYLAERHDIVFTVKKGPVINDATMEDAIHAGIDRIAQVIDTGSNGIGVKWSAVSRRFLEAWDDADIVISKGQANFETTDGSPGTIFHLLRAKCPSVAEALGVKFGDIVLAAQKNG